MPLLPRLFSKPFTFSELSETQEYELLPKAEITASARLRRLQEKLNFRATKLDNYMPSGGHLQKGNKSLSQEDRDHFFDLHQSLREPQTWKNAVINKFKKPWKKQHGPYSHFAPKGLLKVARYLEETRPLLESLQKEAPRYAIYKNEDDALTFYKDYLSQYEETINKQQKYIAKSLYARIMQAFKSRDLNNHEPLRGLYQEIKQSKPDAILPNFTPLNSTLPLPQALNYCLAQGNTELRKSLRQLMRLNSNTKLISIEQDKEWLLIPHSMEKLVPRKPAFFAYFSPGYQLRYQFFKNQQELLFKLATINTLTSKVPSWKLSDDCNWQALLGLTFEVNEALRQADLTPVKGFFKKDSTRFIEQWKILLKEQKQKINNLKLDYLKQLMQTPQPYDWVLSLNNLQHAIRQMNMEINSCEELKESWEVLEKNLNNLLSPPSTLSLLDNGIKQIQLSKTMSKPFFDMLLEALQSIDLENKEMLKYYHSPYSGCLQQCLSQQLKVQPLPFELLQQTVSLLKLIDMAADINNGLSQLRSDYPNLDWNILQRLGENPQGPQQENSARDHYSAKNKILRGENAHTLWQPLTKKERSPQSPIPSDTNSSQSPSLLSSSI